MPAPAKLYRYALFGRSDSGKTCILTAMSMSHRSNPAGYTVTWVPDPPEASTRDPEVAKQYQEGKAMLLRARAAMDAGDKPPPNPLSIHKYRFDFTTRTPHPRTYHAELADYSGELIDPRMNAESLARKLRDLLNTMDGLFVLAEAPRVGEEGTRMSREFELLQQAFALLANERQRRKGQAAQTPVVLMFNKWDRRYPGTATPEQRASQIDDFLLSDPEPPHKSLADFLAGAVSEGCFHSVAVSAFGQARMETQTDRDGVSRQVELPPLTRPLPSYGLEDGFVWAAQRQDELDLSEYELRAKRLAVADLFPSLFLNAFWPPGATEVRKEGTALAARFPKASEQHRRASVGAGKAMRVAVMRTAVVAASLFGLLLGGEATFDVWRLRKAEADIARENLSVEDMSRHRGLLEAYQTSPAYRHVASRLFVSRDEAKTLLGKINTQLDKSLWDKVPQKKNDSNAQALTADDALLAEQDLLLAQRPPAQAYLDALPGGPNASRCLDIIGRADLVAEERKIDTEIQQAKKSLNDLKSTKPEYSELDRINRIMTSVLSKENITGKQRKLIVELQAMSSVMKADWGRNETLQAFTGHLNNDRFADAGAVAHDLNRAGADVKHLARDMMSQAKISVGEHIRRLNWTDAQKAIGEIQRGWVTPDLLGTEDLNALRDWQAAVYKGRDKQLYADVRRLPSKTSCSAYLNSGIPDVYRLRESEVKAYEAYLNKLEGQLDLSIKVTSFYMGGRVGRNYRNYTADIKLGDNQLAFKSGQTWLENTAYTDADTKQDKSGLTAYTTNYKVKLSQEVTITGKLGNYHNVDGYESLGTFSWTGSVSKLVSGNTLVFDKTEYYVPNGNASWVKVVATGLPVAPPLPEYTK